jgi:outer membrane lipoprotein SlyB
MVRIAFMAATALALAGCAGSESTTQAAFGADDARCKSDGVNPGTDAYVQCRLAIDLQKANAERAAEAAQRSRPRP